MAQVWKIRLPNGEVVRPGEWSSTPLWSTVEIGGGPIGTLKAFSYGVGGDVPGSNNNTAITTPRRSTFQDTNMEGGGNVLAENEELLLYGLQIEVFVANYDTNFGGVPAAGTGLQWQAFPTLGQMLALQQNTLVVMKIANTKEYARERLAWFPAGMGTLPYLNNASQTGVVAGNEVQFPLDYSSNGGVNVWDNREFATPHHVAPGEAFEVALQFPTGSVLNLFSTNNVATSRTIRTRIYAAGYRKRPVA